MALPNLKPSDRIQLTERHHSDPPALWVSVILGSIIIHVFAFWILRLLLMGSLPTGHSAQALIPVDVIPAPSKATSPTRLTPNPSSATVRNSTPGNTSTRRTSNRGVKRQPTSATTSATTSSSTRANSQQPRKQPSPTIRKSPASNSSQNQQPGTKTPSTKPNPPAENNSQSGSGTSSPNPTPSPESSTGQVPPSPNPNPQQEGGFNASLGELSPSAAGTGIPDKLCKMRQNNPKKFSKDELKGLGVNLDSVLVLQVVIVIETNGKAEVQPKFTEVQQGNISADNAVQLAREVIKSWQFEPNCTFMEGAPIPYPYNVKLIISPSQT